MGTNYSVHAGAQDEAAVTRLDLGSGTVCLSIAFGRNTVDLFLSPEQVQELADRMVEAVEVEVWPVDFMSRCDESEPELLVPVVHDAGI